MKNSFSYNEYLLILDSVKAMQRLKDFKEINENTLEFIIIRHDVEFSVERGYKMAKLEADIAHINTSYFFQIRNNSYNVLSKYNIDMIQSIYQMGHKVGLHVHLNALEDLHNIKEYIIKDVKTLQYYTEIPVDRFSFHRPSSKVLSLNLRIDDLINTYSDKYFHFIDNETNISNLRIKYFSDSMHRWKYGYPDKENLKKHKKVQILIHPYSWTEAGYDSEKNFETLIDEKTESLIDTLEGECKHFKRQGVS